MIVPTDLWDTHKITPGGEDGARLGRIISGNDGIAAEPGLALTLLQGNATVEQAGAINQFVGALNAEKMVRAAGAAGTKVRLTPDQKSALQQMGIDYAPVEWTAESALTTLKSQMAAQGKQPVLDSTGKPKVDKDGNVLAEPMVAAGNVLPGAASAGAGGGGHGWFDSAGSFFHHLTHNATTNVAGNVVQHGNFDWQHSPDAAGPHEGFGGVTKTTDALQEGYQYVSTTASEIGGANRAGQLPDLYSTDDADLAKRLGYDPGSFFSMQAFKARGYAHGSTGALANAWDVANPKGLFGLDGTAAVTEAEVYATDPEKYLRDVTADTTLAPEDAARKIAAASSKQFQDLVTRVNAAKADIGTDVARGVGIDPVKHPDLFNYTAAGTNLVAAFATDPLAFGLGALQARKVATVTVGNIGDAESVRRVLTEASQSMAQASVKAHVNGLVSEASSLRAAQAAGDHVLAARISARVNAQNPFAPLLPDFVGGDQILPAVGGGPRLVSETEALQLGKGDLPFVYGRGDPITTYDQAVDYLSSRTALLRIQGGKAMVDSSVMPGALSSWGYLKLRGKMAAWSAGRSAAKSETAAEKFTTWATKDPGRLQKVLDDKLLVRTMPLEDDAVDALTGKTLAGDFTITDAGRGYIRGNQIRYGQTVAPGQKLERAVSAYTLGLVQRAKLTVARFTNWLPRDTAVDITSAASEDSIRKIARTYLTTGDTNMLASRWASGDYATRKAIVQGLKDQIGHAAGLSRTKAGRELMDSWKSQREAYSLSGDEILDANGVPMGLFPGQLQTRFVLPNFGAVHKAAAKIGLYEGTIGRLLGSTPVEKLLIQWRLGALFTPVTAVRANIESWLNLYAEGMLRQGIASKAILRERGVLNVPGLGRSRPVDAILSLAPLQAAGRFYRHAAMKLMPEAEVQELLGMPEDRFWEYIREQAAAHYAMETDPSGMNSASEIAANGFNPVKVSYGDKHGFDQIVQHKTGYELTDEVDGLQGANLYAHNLAIRVDRAPDLARAIIAHIKSGAEGDAEAVATALESGAARNVMAQSGFGKLFQQFDDGPWIPARTADERAVGKLQWANRITEDFRRLITGRNTEVQTKITDYIETHGKAPDADWILDHVKGLNRPEHLLKPTFVAVEKNGLAKGVDALLDVEGKAYQWMVERLIQRHTTSPAFGVAYAQSKVGLSPFKQKLIDGGLSEEAAERATANVAMEQAWARIARAVDDPRMKSQMDVVGRSFFAFSRATTMMLRRWGGTFWRNPAQARKFQLAGEAAVHSGLVYKDENGDWMFHFPASGVAQEVLMHAASHIPGLSALAPRFPVSDFTGRVTSIIPGSDNPFQYNTNPIVSIAGRDIAGQFPDHREWFDEIDRKLNGDMGQGKGFWDTIEPSLVKKFTDPLGDERDSITTSAMIGSLYNLYAAGIVPEDGASPAEIETFMGRLRTQAKSQLYLRSVFGAFSPATLSVPENETGASAPDAAYARTGVQGLRDEYKQILNDTGGDFPRATAIWTALHPDLTVYTQSGTRGTTKGVLLPATETAFKWMAKNTDFIQKYKDVAAFFIPAQKAGEPFSMSAYRAQLEEGLRQRKTPDEFLNDVRVASAAGAYYQMEDQYNADLARAKAAGDDQLASQHRADWSAWSKAYKAAHPAFAQSVEASAGNIVKAQSQMADLRDMLKRGNVPASVKVRDALLGMVQAYDGYVAFRDANPGSTNAAEAARSAALQQFQDYLVAVTKWAPEIESLYTGVFRPLSGYALDPINN